MQYVLRTKRNLETFYRGEVQAEARWVWSKGGAAERAEQGQPLPVALLERERKQGGHRVRGRQGGQSGFFFSCFCFGGGGGSR